MEDIKTSELLAGVYRNLWDGDMDEPLTKERYICCAIGVRIAALVQSAAVKDCRHEVCTKLEKARQRIQDKLDGQKTNSLYKFYTRTGVPEELALNTRWMQLRRREFLCNLISEYEREGD